jgi:hypothetical protein
MKNQKKSKRILIVFFIFGIVSILPLIMQLSEDTNNNYEILEYDRGKSETPKISSPDLNITSPENKTYVRPMSGYYPATYGFENDQNGTEPSDWIIWRTAPEGGGGTAYITENLDGHEKVVDMHVTSATDNVLIHQYFPEAPTNGTIELYVRKSTTTQIAKIIIGDEPTAYQNSIYLSFDVDGYLKWHNGTAVNPICTYQANRWYHIRVEFDCGSNWHLWVDGISQDGGSGYPFRGNPSVMDEILIHAESPDDHHVYLDAISYSWDPNHNIGDNLNEGLLLSFDNSTTLEWMGYSLDGQANKTILGNSSIPIPSNGLHTIQVFGNETSGTMHESNTRYFTVGEIEIITPENKTYIGPMSGYYPATYGFENDNVGSFPTGWIDNSAGASNITVASEIGGHKNVAFFDDNDGNHAEMQNAFTSAQMSGTYEYWIRYATTLTVYYYLRDGSNNILSYCQNTADMWRYYSGVTSFDTPSVINTDVWYHHRVDFNSTSDTYDWYIDGVKIADGASYFTPDDGSGAVLLEIITHDAEVGAEVYFDAKGYSWDPNYNIGDNLNEGLLLSFENGTTLDWIGYSLDGQANKTILGNSIINIPNEGLHTIKVSGNDTVGTWYQSSLRYFTVNTSLSINIITPENTTYTNPMSGYYPATYGFENEINGAVPDGGWISNIGYDCELKVISELDGHKKVLEFTDNNNSDKVTIRMEDNFWASSNTYEYYARTTDASKLFATGIYYTAPNQRAIVSIMQNKFQYYDGSYHDVGVAAANDTWYHIKIEHTSTNYYLYIDGTQYGPYGYQAAGGVFNANTFTTDDAPSGYSCYIDAVGFQTDVNYTIGDNLNEGLLLNFTTDRALDWMGYSLDGGTNKTILGNTTIPMPSNGLHTIQVFGNNTFGVMGQSQLQYFTVYQIPNITIITPENKTYDAPMSGYYPATYGFENDANGSTPYGWNDLSISGNTVQTINSINNHNKVIELYKSGSDYAKAQQVISGKTSGIIEFWWMTDDNSKESTVELAESGSGNYGFFTVIYSGSFQSYNGTDWIDTGIIPNNNEWYHHKIEFDCSSDTFNWTINQGIYSGVDLQFRDSVVTLDWLELLTYDASSGYHAYFDAIGYSWDSNYNIGDNLNKGLLLSFDNSSTLDWRGYSLDGQANKTIFGNTTIPMPSFGLHTIQVFGNNTFGAMGQSQLRYFTVNLELTEPSIEGPSSDLYITQLSPLILQWNITEINNDTYEIRRNGSIVGSGGYENWKNVSLAADTSTVGDWNYTLFATDTNNNIGNNTVIVHVIDITNPNITGPGTELTLDQFSFYDLHWNITEINNGTYEIWRNGTLDVTSTPFTHWFNITRAVNNYTVGDWNYTIIATDPSGNKGNYTVIVHLLDNVNPTIVGPGPDFIVEQDTLFNLTWNVTEVNNGTFVILRNGVVNDTGSFINGVNVSIAVVTNFTGIWNFTIIATDPSLNSESDTVIVRIYDKDHEMITPGASQIINKTGEEPGLLFYVNTTEIAILEFITNTINLIGKGIGTDITALYFYNN